MTTMQTIRRNAVAKARDIYRGAQDEIDALGPVALASTCRQRHHYTLCAILIDAYTDRESKRAAKGDK